MSRLKTKFSQLKLRQQFLLAVFFVLLVGTIVLVATGYNSAKQAGARAAVLQMKHVAESVVGNLEGWVNDRLLDVSGWSDDIIYHRALAQSFVSKSAKRGASRKLANLKHAYGYYRQINLVDNAGFIVASSNPEIVDQHLVADEAYFLRTVKGKPMFTDAYPSEEDGDPVMIVAAPLVSSDLKKIGVIYGVIDLAYLESRFILTARVGESGRTLLFNQDGEIISDFTPGKVFRTRFSDLLSKGRVFTRGHSNSGAITYEDNGQLRLGVALTSLKTNWIVLVDVYDSEISRPAEHVALTNIATSFMVIIAIGVAVVVLVGRITRPINALTDVMTLIAEGRTKVHVPYGDRKDEIGRIAGAVEVFKNNAMQIGQLLEDTEKANMRLEKRAGEEQVIANLLHLSHRRSRIPDYLTESLEGLVDFASFLQGKSCGAIFLNEQEGRGNMLRLVASRNFPADLFHRCQKVPFGQCFCGTSAETREIVLKKAGSTMDCERAMEMAPYHEYSHYSVPLMLGNNVLGVMVLFVDDDYDIRPGEQSFLARVADVLSVGISKRMAENALQQLNADLEKRVALRTAELHIAKNDAEQASQAKSEFLAKMSHELRTPLNAIIGITEMLEEEAQDDGHDENLESLSRVRRAGEHLLSLINEILDLSKIEAGKMEFNHAPFDIRALLELVLKTSEPLARKGGNRLEVICPDDIGEMTADMIRVQQVLLNLLSNACKFTNDGLITLKLSRFHRMGREWVEFVVDDTGIGLKAEQIDRLFEDFAQADETTARTFGGTGLGLSICKKICSLMDGEISVESVFGEGATFRVRLPANCSDAVISKMSIA